MLMFMGGWKPGLLFTEFYQQMVILPNKLTQGVQPVLPIKGGRKHETGQNCQCVYSFASAQGQMKDEDLLGSERSGMEGMR